MVTHSSILAWRIPWTEEPGGLFSPWDLEELDTTEPLTLHFSGSKYISRIFFLSGFLKKIIYLFIYDYAGHSLLHRGFLQLLRVGSSLQLRCSAPLCSGFSCYRVWALERLGSVAVGRGLLAAAASLVIGCGLQSTWAQQLQYSAPRCSGFSCYRVWALERLGSVVVGYRLRCPPTCGIFLKQGSNLCPLHWLADSCPLRHQGSPKVPGFPTEAGLPSLFTTLSYELKDTFMSKQDTFLNSIFFLMLLQGFPGGSVVKNPPANPGGVGLISGPGSFHMWWGG